MPEHVIEIGTWKGHGSTYFIAEALDYNKKGVLHSIERERGFHDEAARLYRNKLSYLKDRVDLNFGQSTDILPGIIEKCGGVIDLVFFDGSQHEHEAYNEYKILEPHLRPGSYIVFHDWMTEKCNLMRPTIRESGKWRMDILLSDGNWFAGFERIAK